MDDGSELSRDIVDESTCREIGHDRAARIQCQPGSCSQRQCVFLADVAAQFVDDCQTVCIGILCESNDRAFVVFTTSQSSRRFSSLGSGGWANRPSVSALT